MTKPSSPVSDGVWHGLVPELPPAGVLYGFRVSGEGGWDTPFRWDSSRVLLDPYAKHVAGRSVFGKRDEFEQFELQVGDDGWLGDACSSGKTLGCALVFMWCSWRRTSNGHLQKGSVFRGTFSFKAAPFDWGKEPETRPRYDTKDLVIYEMPLRSFTASPSSQLAEGLRGTYRGLKEKARGALEHMG